MHAGAAGAPAREFRTVYAYISDDAIVRMSAFNLFGKLSRLLHSLPRGLDYLQDHIHYHLVSILIHINDDNRAVQQSAVESLREIARVLKIAELKYYA